MSKEDIQPDELDKIIATDTEQLKKLEGYLKSIQEMKADIQEKEKTKKGENNIIKLENSVALLKKEKAVLENFSKKHETMSSLIKTFKNLPTSNDFLIYIETEKPITKINDFIKEIAASNFQETLTDVKGIHAYIQYLEKNRDVISNLLKKITQPAEVGSNEDNKEAEEGIKAEEVSKEAPGADVEEPAEVEKVSEEAPGAD
ncbi:MAG: hypothetical protein K9L98_01640, partial [Candidatus Pacebacteria bacterium]|nr:hypothetical protein [Candidatus Paceibacterota bacterium]